MRDAFFGLLNSFHANFDRPYQYLTLQFCFITYLVLGQVLVLLLWRLLRPATRSLPGWAVNLVFAGHLLAAQVALLLTWPTLVGAWLLLDYTTAADVVVVVHLGIVLVVVGLLVLVPVGGLLGWTWTRNFWLRLTHLLIIEVVAGQAIVGIECPFTTAERQLRFAAAQQLDPTVTSPWGFARHVENASPLGRWANQTLFLDGVSKEVIVVIYAAVGLLVLLGWAIWPPRLPWRDEPPNESGPDGTSRLIRPS